MKSGRRPHRSLRALPGLLFWLALLAPVQLLALSLGEVEVLSALGDPVEVEIPVEDWGGIDPQDIRASLAARSQYESFGLDWSPVLDSLALNLVGPRLDGSLRILVSTRAPVSEPYVELLLALRWPGGSLLREYVVLFDLPPSAEPAFSQSAAAVPSGRRRYQVQAGAVFWNIAQQFLAAEDEGEAGSLNEEHRLYQMLLALFELNPAAFINDNISLLRADAVLQIPVAADLQRIDRASAKQRFDTLWAAGTRALQVPEPAVAEPRLPGEAGVAEPAFPEPSSLSTAFAVADDEDAEVMAMPAEVRRGAETGGLRPGSNGWLLPANTPVIMSWSDTRPAAEQEGRLLQARQHSIDTLTRTRSLGGTAQHSDAARPALGRLALSADVVLTTLALQAERRARLYEELQASQLRLQEALAYTASVNARVEAVLAAKARVQVDRVDLVLALVMLSALLLALGLILHLLLRSELRSASRQTA